MTPPPYLKHAERRRGEALNEWRNTTQAFLFRSREWQPVKISTWKTILKIERENGKEEFFGLYCCRMFRWSLFLSKKALMVVPQGDTFVLGFATSEERCRWEGIIRNLRTIHANMATYNDGNVQIVSAKNRSKYIAMCQSGYYKPNGEYRGSGSARY